MPSPRQLKKLLKVYSKNLKQSPDDLDLRIKLAEVLRLLGRVEEAVAFYSSIAWAYGVAGNLSQAINLCKIILELNPQHSETQEMLAKLYASQKIREKKQSIPVVKVGQRWVVDPKKSSAVSKDSGAEASRQTPGSEVYKKPLLASPDAGHVSDDEKESVQTSAEVPRMKPKDDDDVDASKDRQWLAVAPTKRAVPEDFIESSSAPVIVTSDHEGKLKFDPSAPQPGLKRTLKLGSEEAQKATVPPVSEKKPTLPQSVVERHRVVEDAAGKDDEKRPPVQGLPGSEPWSEVDAEEPTQLEEEEDQQPPARAMDVETVVGEELERPPSPSVPELKAAEELQELAPILEPTPAPELESGAPAKADSDEDGKEPAKMPFRKPPHRLEPEPALVSKPDIKLEEPTDLEEQTILKEEPGDKEVVEQAAPQRPAHVDTDVDEQDDREAEDQEAEDREALQAQEQERVRLSTAQMMGQLSAKSAPPPSYGDSSEPELGSAAGTATPSAEQGQQAPEADQQAAVRPDPLRFLRTTRRYATVDSGAVFIDEDTEIKGLDSSMVSSVIRMDNQASGGEDERGSRAYSAIQREVNEAGQEQEDKEIPLEEEEEVDRDLSDTIRELPEQTDPFEQDLPRVPFPLFSDLDTGAFLAMVDKLERREHGAGSLIFQEGDPGDSLFLVSAGSLQVLKTDEDGRQIELARLGAGSFFGEFALLTDRRRHASVRCVDDSELLELRRDVLVDLIEKHPSIAWTLRIFYQQRLMAMVLATSPLFKAVSPEDRRAVLSRFTIRRILEGETIIEEGRPTSGFYVILVGEVSVSCRAEDDMEVPLGNLSEGDYFGEISLLTGSYAAATVRSNQLTEVLTLNARDFYDLTSTHPEIWAEVQEKAERRQQQTADRLAGRLKAAGPIPLI